MASIDQKEYLSTLISQDPGLPRPNPTQSYWQQVLHPLSDVQSATLPPTIDIAIIGSGITGASVTKTILESDPTKRITVFEARTLCSGATGRNGGQLAINAAETYLGLKEAIGSEMAGSIFQFNTRTLDRLREVARDLGVTEYVELTEVQKIRFFKDADAWRVVKEGVEALQADHPSLGALYKVLSSDDCVKLEYSQDIAGAVAHPSGTIWPYRLVTKVFEHLLDRFPSRLAIETNTPIIGIDYDLAGDNEFPYRLQTPRGVLRAAQIAHCTNAYTSHLFPALRGIIYPLKGTMTVQDLGSKRPNQGSNTSWAIHYTPFEDPQEGSVADGLIYGMQNTKTGTFFFGGEKAPVSDMLSANDAEVSPSSVTFLCESLLSLFGEDKTLKYHELVSSWSGIMGFTSDGMPLVGRVPQSIAQRRGENEWMCAGFNGYGMPVAWLAGENLAKMILGHCLDSQFPVAYLLSEDRVRDRLSLDNSVRRLASL